MAQETRFHLFDTHDFRRIAPVHAAQSAGAAPLQLTDNERLMVADGLTELGYSARQVRLILGGPDKASVEQAIGKRIAVRTLPSDESRSPDESRQPQSLDPAAESSSGEGAGPPPSLSYPARSATNLLGIDQGDVVDALWHTLHGDPSRLANLAANYTSLTGALQAYLLAATEASGNLLDDFAGWEAEFLRQLPTLASRRAKNPRTDPAAISGVGATVAVQAYSIPVLGKRLAQMLRVGAALRDALLLGYPLPLGETATALTDQLEGADAYLGLSLTSPAETFQIDKDPLSTLKDVVTKDEVAPLLPEPRRGTRYSFTPTLGSFQEAAHALGLYPGEANTLFVQEEEGAS